MKKKYSTGGQILSAAAMFIPGWGQVISPLINLADKKYDQTKAEDKLNAIPPPPPVSTKNPFGYKHGGFIGDGFKQYRTGSHASGKDLMIDKNGNPNPSSMTVQNQENAYKLGGRPYVMSDVLKNPTTGRSFNDDAAILNRKFKQARFFPDQKNTLNFGMNKLATANDKQRAGVEGKQFYNGGPLSNIDWATYQVPVPTPSVPPGNPMFYNSENRGISKDANMISPLSTLPKPITPVTSINQTTPTLPDLTQSSNFSVTEKSQPNPGEVANGIGLGLKGLALGRSAYDALQSPEKESLITPDYSQSDKYLREATINYAQARNNILGQSNVLGNLNRSSSRNFAQYLGRESARVGQSQQALANISEQETNANSQLNLAKSQYEANKSVDIANRTYQNQQNNMMNQANQRGFQRDFFSNLSQVGSEFNKYGETQKTIQNRKEIQQFNNNQVFAYLKAKYPNVQVSSDITRKFQNGEISVDDYLSFLPPNVQQDVKQQNGK